MRRFPTKVLMPAIALAMLFCSANTANAQLFDWFGYWGSYRPYYSSYYSPAYSTYYSPSYYSAGYAPTYYSASYAPSYYTADYTTSYVPTTTYYAPLLSSSSSCCSSGGCGLQTSYSYAHSSSCCSPCTSCVSSCNSSCSSCLSPCGNCGTCSNCTLNSSPSPSSAPTPANPTFENQGPTTVQPRSDTGGTQPRTPTFIEEQDRSKGTNYENQNNPPNGDPGFAPRNPSRDERSIDPLDQTFGTSSSANDGELRFKIPSSIINHRQPAPSHKPETKPTPAGGNNENSEAEYPLLRLDEKITTRTLPTRTRLVRRQSWSQPVIARAVPRQTETMNLGWVPVPLPTQLVQK